jgi:hypothetical protein
MFSVDGWRQAASRLQVERVLSFFLGIEPLSEQIAPIRLPPSKSSSGVAKAAAPSSMIHRRG